MAAGSGEDDSVWPGYVDALTTMVMVMTMVMMILGVVVFGTSQGISRKFLERVAEAANVDVGSDASTKKLSDEVLAWVQRHADLGSAPYLSPGEDKPRGGATQGTTVVASPGVTSRQFTTKGPLQADVPGPTVGPNVGPPLDDITATAAVEKLQPFSARAPGSELVETPGQGWPAAPFRPEGPSQGADAVSWPSRPHQDRSPDPAEEKPARADARQVAALDPSTSPTLQAGDPGSPPREPVEIVSRQRPDLEPAKAGSRVERDAGARPAITVRFEDRATRLDQDALDQVRKVVQSGVDFSGANTFTITGRAAIAGSSVSDARRTAYYRVIAVREALIAAGIRPGALRLGVVDTTTVASDVVTITTAN